MNRLILIVIFYSISCSAFADCADMGILVWPYSKTLKKNSVILLSTGFGGLKYDVLSGLNKKYLIYLKSGDQKISLNVIEICKGSVLMQVLLKPNTELKEGLEYELFIDSISNFKKGLWIGKWNFQKQRIDPTPKWIVTNEKDEIAPVWLADPKEVGKYYGRSSCPTAIYVKFSCNFSDTSMVLVRLTVKNLTTGKTYVYYSEPLSDIVRIGNFWCRHEYNFVKETNYEANFTLMDASGNYSKELRDKLLFSSPIPSDYQ